MIPIQIESVRIDKWLWSVRICKTRAIALDLCKRNRVKVTGLLCKPSRSIHLGDKITVTLEGIDWVYEVLQVIDQRVGAKIVNDCRKDLTSQESLDKLARNKSAWAPRRPKGSGRPTKKERRQIDQLNDRDDLI